MYTAPAPTVSYETRPAYVYQKVAGYCTEKVTTYGYGHTARTTVDCKAGEAPAPALVEKAPEPAPAPAPAPVEPPK